jgi:hypothetical protein
MGVRTPPSLCSDVKLIAVRIRTSVVKMHHIVTYLQQLRPSYLHRHSNCLIATNIFWCVKPDALSGLQGSREGTHEVQVGVRTPFCLSSDVKMRAGLIRNSVVKMQHFTSHCSIYAWLTSTSILITWYQLAYFNTMASFCKTTVPYPGCRRYTWSINTLISVTFMLDRHIFI